MAKLENAIGASGGSVDKWEKNKSVPGGVYIIALSNFFSVSTDWILKGEHSEQNKQNDHALFLQEKREVFSQIENLQTEDREFLYEFIEMYVQKKIQGAQLRKNNKL